MTNNYREQYQKWLDSPSLSNLDWEELNSVIDNDAEIKSRFYAPLEFGTAGLRGIMGMGINRMNIHVVRHATQAFAAVICNEGGEARTRGVVICYDCRHQSDVFAREAAMVMAANGIRVRLFDSLRPTPELSFAIRHFGAVAGINITASHNPKEYNGYKVYWSDGAQLPPAHAQAIAKAMDGIDIFCDVRIKDYDIALQEGLIEIIGNEVDQAFLTQVMAQSIQPQAVSKAADELKIVYTPFHGAGYRLVPEALRRLGVKNLYPVPEQMVIDGDFPTVKSPNPENPEGFALAIELAKKKKANLIIGTDPDSDRVGTMALGQKGEFIGITGNQMGVLLLDYLINAHKNAGTLPENAAVLKTIVTTEMAREVAVQNGIYITDTFTGFKFMAEKIAEFERTGTHEMIFAYEESYGYMIGSFVRDKDAVTASMLIAEMAAYYQGRNMTLINALDSLYERYGYFGEVTHNIVMPGIDGLERMRELMASLRNEPPAEIAGVSVLRMRDYQSGRIIVAGLGAVDSTDISGSNVLYFEMSDGTSFIIRPSGTEPKIKIYILARGESRLECNSKIEKYARYANSLN